MTTPHRPICRVCKRGSRWYVLTRVAPGFPWGTWATHQTHARALAHALSEVSRLA